jgi:protein-disulfide isomerase
MQHRFTFAALFITLVSCGGAPGPVVPKVDLPPAVAAGDLATLEKNAAPEDDAVIPIEVDDAAWGSRLAPVTIVQFSDFECPFCARVEITMDELKRSYGPEKLRVVFKHYPLPFHPHSRAAAEASVGVLALAGNKGFWAFHGLAFTAQSELGQGVFEQWAAQAGANVTALRAGLEHHTWADKVHRDEELVTKLGVQGTPHFFINGVSLGGAQPIENFKNAIDGELAKAQEKLAQGTPRDRLYRTMAEANYKKPVPDKDDDDDDKPVSADVFKVPVGTSPVRGDKAALVTIVEFSDFQCPYCKRVEATLKGVMTAYPKDVRLVWKHAPLPFHKRAEPAAQLSIEARAQKGDAGFWDVHDRIFAESALEDADLLRVASAAGLDAKKVATAMASHKWQKTIDDDGDLGDDVQAGGTPHFFINGRRLVGAQPEAKFKALIDEELQKARATVAQGTPAAKLYDAIIAPGKFTPPAFEKRDMPDAKGFPTRGAANAPVTIVEFSDFECAFCKIADATLDDLIKAYAGKVKIVFRNYPLPMHGHARLAAESTLEARAQKGDAGFEKMREALFAHTDHLERADIEGYAQQQGLDVAKLKAALDGRTHSAAVDADMDAAKAAKLDGVPAFFINGYYLSGAQPLRKFRRVVDMALKDTAPKNTAPAAKGAKP